MSGHSKIGASSMYRWSACPGSVRVCDGIESKSSSYAEDGTRAHELAAVWLSEGKPTLNHEPFSYSEEMEKAVETYVETVLGDGRHLDIQVEVKFDLSEIYPGLYGTADAVVYDQLSRILRVYDYKHGQGILVEVKDNVQLKYYALGALLHSRVPCKEVELVIVQPRANHPDGPVRRWRFNTLELVDFAADLENYARKTTEPNAPLVSGAHCRFCPAAGVCPELAKTALAVAQTEFRKELSYDPQKLSDTLKKLDVLEAYTKSVREFAYNEAEHGRCPPGWKLVQKRASRKWARDEDTIATSLRALDLKLQDIYDSSLRSPAQIEKLLAKENKSKLGGLVSHVSSGMTLVEESDPRPHALTSPQDEFSVITEQP